MFISAGSYALLTRILKRERIMHPDRLINEIDAAIRREAASEIFHLRASCRGPNGERLIFVLPHQEGEAA